MFGLRSEIDGLSRPVSDTLRFGLAPMEGVTDWPARIWFALVTSPDFMWTPFLRVTETFPAREIPDIWCPEIATPQVLDESAAGWTRVIPQLMATNADDFVRVAEMVLRLSEKSTQGDQPGWVDLNCGCPSPVVVGGCAGSSLLRDPQSLRAFLESATRRLGSGRVSVKIRAGYDDAREFPNLVDALAGLPLAQVAVHGRTRPERYLGRSRLDLIHHAATSLASVPVVGSGDICDAASARAAVAAAPSVRSWIIGRGALRNPWIFGELREGRPIRITLEIVQRALMVFACLHELYWHHPQLLLRAWENGVSDLLRSCGTQTPGRRALSRTKMLWNYMRSSMPLPLRDGNLLRSSTIQELLDGIAGIWRAQVDQEIALVHDPAWDWVYNGSGKSTASGGTQNVRATGNQKADS